jgi:hypothetical protein
MSDEPIDIAPAPGPRDVVTPYAFQVHPALLGLPLARPWRRAVAIAVDGLAIGLLAQVPNPWLALATGTVLLRSTFRARPKPLRRRGWLRALAVALLLAGTIGIFTGFELHIDGEEPTAETEAQQTQSLEVARLALDIVRGACRDLSCARGPLLSLADISGRQVDLEREEAWESATELMRGLEIDAADAALLREEFLRRFETSRRALDETGGEPPPGRAREAAHSVLGWATGLLDDLGIGLGWAALYFTVFAAWWNGQTPGKKLLGIRVVQLDGTSIGLWEAFERCGGYGAGFATGLLGFAQVWWDPNRQAIHDKIAETVVIRGALPAGTEDVGAGTLVPINSPGTAPTRPARP